jgi:hypothetical protein
MRFIPLVSSLLLSGAPLLSAPVFADVWSPTLVTIESIKPLAAWQGGILRIKVSSPMSVANCVSSNEIDLSYSVGTSETRSAVIAALYLAFASQQSVKFMLSDTSCSFGSIPTFTGLEVIS